MLTLQDVCVIKRVYHGGNLEHAGFGHFEVLVLQPSHQRLHSAGREVQDEARSHVSGHDVLCYQVPILDEADEVAHAPKCMKV